MNDRVAITVNDHIADVRLNRPDKMNALDPAMFEGIISAGERLQATSGIRAIVLSGEGRAFCAGLDMASFGGDGITSRPLTDRTHGNTNKFQQAAMLWRNLPAPVIAAVHGVCFGGGLQIMLGADFRIVAPDARLAIMEMRWGLIPDMGGYALWRDHIRADVLRELTYTNREFSGEEAQRLGFATYVDAHPHDRAMAIAREIAGKNPEAIRAAKDLFNRAPDLNEDDILMQESTLQSKVIGAPNQMEAVMAQMQKRRPRFAD